MLTKDQIKLAQSNLAYFATCVYPNFELAKHLELLSYYLMEVESGNIPRLIISMPPRHGKSFLTSQIFPAWFLGRRPYAQIMLASYGENLAKGFKEETKNFMSTPAYDQIFGGPTGVRLDPKYHTDIVLKNGYKGRIVAGGRKGKFTGKHAHLAIIDDPIKDTEEANSAKVRQSVVDWFGPTFYTRLDGKEGRIIVCATRWHEEDLSGHLIEEMQQGGEKWTVLNLPAINNSGEALWPEKFSLQRLLEIKRVVKDRAFNALYQGNPAPPSGSFFKASHLRYYEKCNALEENRFEAVRYFDLSHADSKASDFTAGALVVRSSKGQFYLEDMVRFKQSPLKRNKLIKAVMDRDIELYGRNRVRFVFEKTAGSGSEVADNLMRVFHNYSPKFEVPNRNKGQRAESTRMLVEAGFLGIRSGQKWVRDFKKELLSFGSGAEANDDQVDALTGCIRELLGGSNFLAYLDEHFFINSTDEVKIAKGRELLASLDVFTSEESDNITEENTFLQLLQSIEGDVVPENMASVRRAQFALITDPFGGLTRNPDMLEMLLKQRFGDKVSFLKDLFSNFYKYKNAHIIEYKDVTVEELRSSLAQIGLGAIKETVGALPEHSLEI